MPEISFEVRAAARLHTAALLRHPNVVGVGAGIQQKDGASTGEPAVVVYVTRKLPSEALYPYELVPRVVVVDEAEVITDVVEAGEPRFVAVDTASYRPVRGGCQIGNAFGSGTAGAVMYDRRDQRIVLLTNNHVLTDPKNPMLLPANPTITQPAGGPRIGEAKRIVPMFRAPLDPGPGLPRDPNIPAYDWFALVDAGIVGLDSNVPAQFDVIEMGRHPYVVLPPFPGLEVMRRGYRSQLRYGTVEATDLTMVSKGPTGIRHLVGGPGGVFSIRSREREVPAMPGDSGSLVVDAQGGAARGLVFASNGDWAGLTWACELGTVMTMLELDTPCTGSLNALIRRAAFRRLADRWALAEEVVGAGGKHNALVAEHIEVVSRFRHGYLNPEAEGTAGQAVGAALERLGPALASALANDEDTVGLLERAFGEWLVQPTVFDMLEYRFSEEAPASMTAAFARLERCGADPGDLSALAGVFLSAAGRSMREVLAASSTTETTSPSTNCG